MTDDSESNSIASLSINGAERDEHITVFARVRPARKSSRNYRLYQTTSSTSQSGVNNAVEFKVPKDSSQGFINNQKEQYDFLFSGVFDQQTNQRTVFETVAQPVILNCLDGYNGTIFAYGQTGSGKTFTITGGAERFEDRGIIPRTLSHIFSEVSKRTHTSYSVRVSYLEIYNNNGYDLLDPDHESKHLEDLPKAFIREDEDGQLHISNIGQLAVTSEEEALNLLFVGDTNRIITTTPSNDSSSRSHCVFTIYIESKETGGTLVRHSKLHLVDLAGSERIKKTNIGGKIMTEAQAINLSLHYLEQVIVALHEKSQGKRVHIPYRNSMLTSVLRDSLGGNCKTVMIATLSAEDPHIDESVSTCRFAQRVAMIRNEATQNQEVDPQLVIKKLQGQLTDLKDQVAVLKGSKAPDAPLTDQDKERCQQLVDEFIRSVDTTVALPSNHPGKAAFCFSLLKKHISMLQSGGNTSGGGSQTVSAPAGPQDEITKLRLMVQSRENEIAMLVGLLKQATGEEKGTTPGGVPASESKAKEADSNTIPSDPAKAFEIFRQKYDKTQTIESNKSTLRAKYIQAKELGEQVNLCRTNINAIKSAIERYRVESSVAALSDSSPEANANRVAEEHKLIQKMEDEKKRYKDGFLALKNLKTEIEHLQHLLENSKKRLQQDFEEWWIKHTAPALNRSVTNGTSRVPSTNSNPPTATNNQTPISSSSSSSSSSNSTASSVSAAAASSSLSSSTSSTSLPTTSTMNNQGMTRSQSRDGRQQTLSQPTQQDASMGQAAQPVVYLQPRPKETPTHQRQGSSSSSVSQNQQTDVNVQSIQHAAMQPAQHPMTLQQQQHIQQQNLQILLQQQQFMQQALLQQQRQRQMPVQYVYQQTPAAQPIQSYFVPQYQTTQAMSQDSMPMQQQQPMYQVASPQVMYQKQMQFPNSPATSMLLQPNAAHVNPLSHQTLQPVAQPAYGSGLVLVNTASGPAYAMVSIPNR